MDRALLKLSELISGDVKNPENRILVMHIATIRKEQIKRILYLNIKIHGYMYC